MKIQNFGSVLYGALLFALLSSAPCSGDYWDGDDYYIDDGREIKEINASVFTVPGRLFVGTYTTRNSLEIINGGDMYVLGEFGIIGDGSASYLNSVTVDGSGSSWNLTGWLRVGYFGGDYNTLSIINGGTVTNYNGSIGASGANYNSVAVSGSGSHWNILNSLNIGPGGESNKLTVADNATASAASLTMWDMNTLYLKSGGALEVTGTFSDANLHMYIGGAAASTYGHLTVNGTAHLDGSLRVVLDGFTPAYGNTFNLFDWNGGVVGSFSDISLAPLPAGLTWNTNLLYTTGDLSVDVCTAITNCYNSGYGFFMEWIPTEGWNSVVQYTTNLGTMPFTDLSPPMPYPANSYTDPVHRSRCFYKVEMSP